MKKLQLMQNEICEYGTICELRMLVYYAKELIESADFFPDEIMRVNDKLLDALDEALSEYTNYMRRIDKV